MNRISYKTIAYGMIIIPIVIIFLKYFAWGYSFQRILPKTSFVVEINQSFNATNDSVKATIYIPKSSKHQVISEEVNNSPDLNLEFNNFKNDRKAIWSADRVNKKAFINYSFSYIGQAIQYKISDSLIIAQEYSPTIEAYLKPTKNIQSKHPFIKDLHQREIGSQDTLLKALTSIYDYCYSLKPKPFRGVTDALTAAKLEEASCNGKSRLFVALCQRSKIPARLVGGVILNIGSKKTSHQWVEVYIARKWVPFDALNGHFAFLPSHYLTLYHGDEFLISHTKNINYDYVFNIKKRLVSNPDLKTELKSNLFNAYKIWEAFERVGISLGLLKIILLLPLGGLIVALFRNVIGVKTFGVFLPALIAIASQETGLMYGLISFSLVVLVVSLVHFPLERLGLLYTPKMVVMLVCVVIAFIIISAVGIWIDINALAYVTLFPIVVITITAERFAKTIVEDGYWDAVRLTIQTLFVASVAYLVMSSITMEALFLGYPELFLFIIGINILLGRWIGLRLTEYNRFKWIIS